MAKAKPETKSPNGSVFISYSRKDKEFVKRLNDALDNSGVQAWVDWEGIELASDWMERIREAVHGADAFLFVLSPDSIKSQVCGEELELGLKNNKKLIPILYRELPKNAKMHEKLASTNWVYLRDKKDDFDATIPKLVEAIATDLDWVHTHTRLLQRALEWQDKKRDNSFLLVGSELEEAERWMTEATAKPNRNVLPLQAEYIRDSRKQAVRRQRAILTGVIAALVVSIALSIIAVLQTFEANKQKNLAIANQQEAIRQRGIAQANEQEAKKQESIAKKNELLAEEREKEATIQRRIALAQIYQNQPGGLNTSTLLALESWNNNPSPDQAWNIEDLIRQNISLLPIPIRPPTPMIQPAEISNIQWSADDERFVTSSFGGNACVWNAEDGTKLYCAPQDPGQKIYDAVFTPDNKYLITASEDHTVRFWNAADGSPTNYIYQYPGKVWDLDISPNGRLLAVANDDKWASYIDLKNLNGLDHGRNFFDQKSRAYSVKFSNDGKWLAIGTIDGTIKLWQVNSGSLFDGPSHPGSSYVLVDYSPNSSYLLSAGGDSKAQIMKSSDASSQPMYPPLLHGDWVESIDFSPDSKWFVTASDDNKVRVWDTLTGIEKLRMDQRGYVYAVRVSPNGEWIASTGTDQTVRIWDAASGAEVMEIPLPSTGDALSFNKDGSRLVVGDDGGDVSIWDISALSARVGYWEFSELAHEVLFTPNGKRLIVNTDDSTVRIFPADRGFAPDRVSTGKLILQADYLTYQMAVSPDSNWAGVVEADSYNILHNKAYLINLQNQSSYPIDHGGTLTDVAFSPDNKWLATAGENAWVYIWDVATKEKIGAKQSASAITSVVFGPAGTWIAAGNNSGQINIYDYDPNNPLPIHTLEQDGSINAIALSHDGKLLATASSEGTIYLWNVQGESFTQAVELKIDGEAEALAFSPDDSLLAIGGSEKFAYLWNAKTGGELARIPHGDIVSGIDFSADGSILATASRKLVQFWNVSGISLSSKNELSQTACSHLPANLSMKQWGSFFGNHEAYQLICPSLPISNE